MSRWNRRDDVARGGDYDLRWERLREQGENVHGEADLIEGLLVEGAAIEGSGSVLDAGCGTGRVSIELDRRGIHVAGVDLDAAMLDTARAKAPQVDWHLGDLFDVDLGRQFDLVAAPGNVMIFVEPGTEAGVIARLADHLRPGGLLVAGFQVAADRLPLADYDAFTGDAGLELVDRWSTWDRDAYLGGDYAVSVHRRMDA